MGAQMRTKTSWKSAIIQNRQKGIIQPHHPPATPPLPPPSSRAGAGPNEPPPSAPQERVTRRPRGRDDGDVRAGARLSQRAARASGDGICHKNVRENDIGRRAARERPPPRRRAELRRVRCFGPRAALTKSRAMASRSVARAVRRHARPPSSATRDRSQSRASMPALHRRRGPRRSVPTARVVSIMRRVSATFAAAVGDSVYEQARRRHQRDAPHGLVSLCAAPLQLSRRRRGLACKLCVPSRRTLQPGRQQSHCWSNECKNTVSSVRVGSAL